METRTPGNMVGETPLIAEMPLSVVPSAVSAGRC